MVALLTKSDSAASSGTNGRGSVRTAPFSIGALGGGDAAVGVILAAGADFFVLIVAATVLGVAGTEDPHRHAHHHRKPNDREQLKGQEEGEEDPLDCAVHADRAVEIQEWIEEVGEFIGIPVGGNHFRSGA